MPTKILAIDDSKTMRLAVKITFAAEDADVTSVSKGSDAVARAKQLSPDVILVDTALGDGEPSGYDVCQSLKSDPATQGTPVLLMVSNQSGVDQARFDAVGADGFINKPFDTQDLIDKVGAASGGASKPAAAAAPVAKPAPKPAPKAAPAPVAARPPARAAAPPKPAVPKPAVRPPAAAAPRPAVPKPAVPKPAARPAARPAPAPAPAAARPAAASAGPIPIAVPIPFTAADSPTPGMAARLAKAAGDAGIDPKVAEAIAGLSREVIESVVWEVVPHLAEEIIKKQAQSA
ncbi:MAG: response regulator [Nannocystales bacterium]